METGHIRKENVLNYILIRISLQSLYHYYYRTNKGKKNIKIKVINYHCLCKYDEIILLFRNLLCCVRFEYVRSYFSTSDRCQCIIYKNSVLTEVNPLIFFTQKHIFLSTTFYET